MQIDGMGVGWSSTMLCGGSGSGAVLAKHRREKLQDMD